MKRIMVYCPNCKQCTIYKNWFVWILRTPFHWFGKRKFKCSNCGKSTYVQGIRMY
jgi:ribosomal protein L33